MRLVIEPLCVLYGMGVCVCVCAETNSAAPSASGIQRYPLLPLEQNNTIENLFLIMHELEKILDKKEKLETMKSTTAKTSKASA